MQNTAATTRTTCRAPTSKIQKNPPDRKRPRNRRDAMHADVVLLTLPDIFQLYGYTESATRHAMRTRGFPAGFRDGMRHVWFKREIDAYFERLAQGGEA